MSFDLGVWYSDVPVSLEEASEFYQDLCENGSESHKENGAIGAFYKELTARWPEIDSVPEEKVGDFDFSPWSCNLDRYGDAIVMCCVWSEAAKVEKVVRELARKQGLVFYDPQADRVLLPDHLNSGEKANWWKKLFRKE